MAGVRGLGFPAYRELFLWPKGDRDDGIHHFLRVVHHWKSRRAAGVVCRVGPEGRVHCPWHHCGDGDVFVAAQPEFLVEGAPQTQHGGFRSRVRSLIGVRPFAADRADIDERSRPLRAELMQGCMTAIDDALEVDVDESGLVIPWDIPEGTDRAYRGIVDPNIDTAEAGDGLLGQ